MSKNALFILFLFIGWLFLSWRYYITHIKQVSLENHKKTENVLNLQSEPILFEPYSSSVIKTQLYDDFIKKIQVELDHNSEVIIIIKGLYDIREKNNSVFENLGFSRARSIRENFDFLNDYQVIIDSEIKVFDLKEKYLNASQINLSYEYINNP
jgi:hypothetical protein